MSTSRLSLFRGIARHLGEFREVTATQDSVSLRQFVSYDQLTVPLDAYNGRAVWYAASNNALSASNAQTARRVVATSPSTTSLTVDADWPGLPRTGDTLYLINVRGYSVTIDEIHDKINALIDQVADKLAVQEASSTDGVSFDWESPYLEYPETWDWITNAQWFDGRSWKPIFKGDLVFEPWDNRVRIKGKPYRMLTGSNVRLIGAVRLSPLDDDADTTIVPAAWLTMRAAAELKREAAMRQGDQPTALTVSNMIAADAAMLAPEVGNTFFGVGGFLWSTRR